MENEYGVDETYEAFVADVHPTFNSEPKEEKMDNCIKLNTCERVLSLKDKDWAGDWQFAKAVREVCLRCPSCKGTGIKPYKRTQTAVMTDEGFNKAGERLIDDYNKARGEDKPNDRLLTDEDLKAYNIGAIAGDITNLLKAQDAKTAPIAFSDGYMMGSKDSERESKLEEQARVERIAKWLDDWWERGKNGKQNWYELEAFIQALKKQEDKMTEPSKTEQELREEIAEVFRQAYWFAREHPKQKETLDISNLTLTQANQILTLVKDAGYKSPEDYVLLLDELHPYKQSVFPKTREDIVKLLRDKGLNDAELTSTSGVLGRIGYEVAIYHIQKQGK